MTDREIPEHLQKTQRGEPVTLLEAMYGGCAVVATDVGGNPEIVDDGKTGLLSPSEDVPRFAEALRRLLEDEALRKAMGTAGRERVASHFTFEGMVEAYCDQYEHLAS